MNVATTISLSEAVEFINGDRGKNYPDRDAQRPTGHCLFLNTKNVRQGYFDFSETAFIDEEHHRRLGGGTLNRNDIVLTIRGTLGNTAIYRDGIPFDVVRINSAMLALRPRSHFDPDFIERYLRSSEFFDWVGLNRRGSAQPHLRTADIETAKFPLFSVPQQRRIVAKIDSLTGKSRRARDHLDHIPRLVEKYKQALLAAIFSLDQTSGWKTGVLEDVVGDALIGLVRGKAEQSATHGVPYVRMNHYDLDGRWNDDGITYVETDERELARYTLRDGDVLFNTRNSFELVGKVALWSNRQTGYVYNNNLLRLRFRREIVPAFALFQMLSPPFRTYLHSVKSATTSVCAIYQRSIMAAPWVYPDEEQQRAIAGRLTAAFTRIDRLASEATSARKLIDRLDQTVLTKAFRGELVPQDPDDEPASVLLERIRAEREVSQHGKRRRGAK